MSSPNRDNPDYDRVGPVLRSGDVARAVVEALRELNHDVVVADRGSYFRVLVPQRCVLTRAAIERQLGHAFHMPGALEAIMPSFKGFLSIDEDRALWELHR